MQDADKIGGYPLIKRSAWLGAKLSFVVLAPICILCWLGVTGVIFYKSISSGVSPFEIISVIDATSPTHLSKIVNGLIASIILFVVGVASCAFTGAAVGAVTSGIRRLRR